MLRQVKISLVLPYSPSSQQLVQADLARLQIELDLARQIQFGLLPHIPPSIQGLDLWGVSQPALHVGGDFYDFIIRRDRPFIFFVGDVSGKGMPAALLMTMVRTVLRAESIYQPAPVPETILRSANEKLLLDFIEVGMFVSAFVGQYDPLKRELIYANAGHTPVIFLNAGGTARLLEADGTALGVLHDCFSCNQRLLMAPGDVLIIGTDGLNEARNPCGECFGLGRLLNQLHLLYGQSAVKISCKLLDAIRDFSASEPQTDDQTVVVLRCTG